ncbi:hypothetical protein [Aequorivita lipolytica]|uniref:Uncharacterized protein n=1 Tax=Aequorivita lipolytica TaxID=153267 RepID=A0A5C6YPV6_9FLAO|nr:hypothetical protein [Aequorivita lipolytica]TXD69357.1 hypothetical protein ESV24_08340 [Aequorivita lipolytica]SRX53708.1 hypothetical protein AEQU2_02939 [Aequorivita lipolytica]
MKKIIIINALLWAALLLGTAALFKDHPNYDYLFFGILIASSIVQGFLAKCAKRNKERCSN